MAVASTKFRRPLFPTMILRSGQNTTARAIRRHAQTYTPVSPAYSLRPDSSRSTVFVTVVSASDAVASSRCLHHPASRPIARQRAKLSRFIQRCRAGRRRDQGAEQGTCEMEELPLRRITWLRLRHPRSYLPHSARFGKTVDRGLRRSTAFPTRDPEPQTIVFSRGRASIA